jgi:hypothetical protein
LVEIYGSAILEKEITVMTNMLEYRLDYEKSAYKRENLTVWKLFVEKACRESGLILKLKSSLEEYPDPVHWHFKKGKERGTLEITLWKKEKKRWFSVQAGRKGPWIQETIRNLKLKLEAKERPFRSKNEPPDFISAVKHSKR